MVGFVGRFFPRKATTHETNHGFSGLNLGLVKNYLITMGAPAPGVDVDTRFKNQLFQLFSYKVLT